MKKIAKDQIESVIKSLAGQYAVYVPVESVFTQAPERVGLENSSQFHLYEEGLPLRWKTNTSLSAKELFFPQNEKMYTMLSEGSSMEIREQAVDATPSVLFGIRSCDMESIDCLDRVFLEKGFEDAFYKVRREKVLLFALGCSTHEDTCFCTSMGIDPQSSPAADVQISDLGDAYGFTAQTARGEEALALFSSLLSDAPDASPVPTDPMLVNVNVDGITEKLEGMFEHPLWDEISPRCIGCSSCSYVCPTCYCFDINSKTLSHTESEKTRCWDCCMFSEYSCMAGGHNPRPSKKERVRNRFLDKLLYNPQRHGRLYCVGCGRCVAKCPVNLEIATTIQKIQAAEVTS